MSSASDNVLNGREESTASSGSTRRRTPPSNAAGGSNSPPPKRVCRGQASKEKKSNSSEDSHSNDQQYITVTQLMMMDFSRQFLHPNHLEGLPRASNVAWVTEGFLDGISDDVLGYCFFSGYLDTFETVRLASCSKRFASIASRHVRIMDLHRKDLSPEQLGSIVTRFPRLQTVDLSNWAGLKVDHLLKLAPLANSLKHLNLKGCSTTDEMLDTFFHQARRSLRPEKTHLALTHLDLSAVTRAQSTCLSDSVTELLSLGCPNLESLNLAWCTNVDDLSMVATSLTNLKDLDVSLTNVTSAALPNMIARCCPKLKRLDLSFTGQTNDSLDKILESTSHHLEDLSARHLADVSLAALADSIRQHAGTALKRVDISYSGSVDDYSSLVHRSRTLEAFQKLLAAHPHLQIEGLALTHAELTSKPSADRASSPTDMQEA